jgi:acetyl-CoA carboxylase/biotin carboxylase 1
VYARAHGLPFVYLSANSGARLGVATEVQKRFKAALKATASGEPTLDYLYLTEEDYTAMQQLKVDVRVSEVMAGSEKRYRIHDIVGSAKEPIGVENLQGSALLAGQMSLNYATVPTISVVTGRSVGIGAYLNRLGRRVVQVSGAPIILTGAAALNRLLGKDVYSSNDQIGGNGIMQPNGVSHWGTKDDLAAIQCVMRWLDYVVPDTTVAAPLIPRAITQCAPDPIDRDVTFAPTVATPYDPRQMLDGALAENGLEGIFDRGSFQEALAEWAPSVVVGRATLGGLPCGVIAVETRTVRKHDPADPADPSSRATFTAQAGQVWFPDSARKTADAMEDFRLERLPCFVVANWRGFSGGMRDMFDEVLKFGASIVDNLRVYDQPVMIYVPKYGELRGGAWVVVDPIINHNGCVRMYADPTARGGILEPAGVVEIKFREPEVRALWRRSRVAELNAAQTAQQLPPLDDAALKRRENQELPIFNDVAVTFADLHDTPTRMLAKGCITGIVPLADARRFFYWALRRATCEMAIARRLRAAGVDGATESLTAALAAVARCVPPPTAAAAVDGADYKALMQANMDDAAYWCSPAAAAVVDAACNSARGARLAAMLKELGAAGPDMAAAFVQAIGALGADVATAVKSML